MLNKDQLRKNILQKERKRYFEISSNFFSPLLKFIKIKFKKKN